MCKYTISHNGCGCQAEDHVDTRNCPYFQRTHVACDRDNPANRNRVTVTTQSRPGKCAKCLRQEREYRELVAMQREQERHKAQDSAEARDRQRAAELHEKKIMEESLAEYNRIHRDQEEKDFQAALEASKEEEDRRKRERESEDLREGLARSREVNFQRSGFDSKDYSQRRQSGNQGPKYSADISEWTANVSRETGPAIPTPPPLPAGVVELSATITQVDRWTISPKEDCRTSPRSGEPKIVPSAPPLPTVTSKASPAPSLPQEGAVSPHPHPTNEGKLKATDYSLPAYGNQDYDRFMVGGRRQPVHESQKLKESTNPKSAALPPAPAPHARLSSTIQPADIPAFTHMQENGAQAPRRPSFKAGPRKSSVSRPSAPSPIEPSADQELQAKLLRRRQWEVEEEAAASTGSTSPTASVSDASSAPGSPAVSRQTVERTIGVPRAPSGTLKNIMDDADIETATVIAPSRLDEKRRTGWK